MEVSDAPLEGPHWHAGAFSASDTLREHDLSALKRTLHGRIGHPNVTLVPGFYSDSLPKIDVAALRPALLVDVDCDLYVSSLTALSWIFSNCLIVPGLSLVRYDDWGTGTNVRKGEQRAHHEISHLFNITWELISEDGRYLPYGAPANAEFRVLDYHPMRHRHGAPISGTATCEKPMVGRAVPRVSKMAARLF